MPRKTITMAIVVLLLMASFGTAMAAMDRSKIAPADQWDLTDLYPTDAAWEQAKVDLQKRFSEMDKYKGHLAESPAMLKGCLDTYFDIYKSFARLAGYAGKKSDLDMRNQKALERRQSLGPMGAEFGSKTAWIDPEILQIPKEKIDKFIKAEPGLKIYKPVLDDILRMKAHTLKPDQEKIMAMTGLLSGAAGSIYGVFSDADIPRAKVTLSDGEEVTLDAQAYTKYRGAKNREDREKVFKAFFGNLNQFKATFGTMMNSEVQSHLFTAKARNYNGDCLAAALDGSNVPTAVYRNLLKNVHENLPTLWRYLKLRKRIMGLDELRYSDLYAPIVKKVDKQYSYEEAKKMVLEALKPLGKDYVDILGKGYDSRWVDVYPTKGKHSGAYSSGSAYDVHPYILLNYNGSYEDVSTLAHESGHTMHSYFCNHNQPFATTNYTIFVAEVASTTNENLLMNYVLKHTDDDAMRLFLLGSYVDNLRLTLFRQSQFAEFELKIHEMVQNGQSLTGENLNKVYGNILKEYYGVDKGITSIDPVCYAEWSYIPHFYYDFYVYTYATSITASTAIANMIEEGKPGEVQKYRKFLTTGNSMPPVEELKIAGVDMTTDQPFTETMKSMNKAMDEMEEILDRMESKK